MKGPLVGVVMGSKSDSDVMRECEKVLDEHKVPYETVVTSAHRNPDKTREYAVSARRRGLKIIIAGAGHAAHLPGFIAAHTDLPVIGVPIPSSALSGLDSLLSIVQMPGGVPVATMALGKSGAKNAAIFALQVLSLSDERISKSVRKSSGK